MPSVLKEILVIILLCVAIGLILCIIFYNYIPINVTVPDKVEAYTTPSSIKNEINEEVAEYPKQNIIFEITDSDLTLYKQSQQYDEGKANPFAAESSDSNTATTTENIATQNSNIENSNEDVTSKTNNSTGTFFEDTKLK